MMWLYLLLIILLAVVLGIVAGVWIVARLGLLGARKQYKDEVRDDHYGI